MNKKSFVLVSVFLLVLFILSSFVYATDEVKNAVNGATNTVVDGVDRLGSDVRNGVGDVENGIEDALTMDNTNNNDVNDTTGNNIVTGDYNATRTTADATTTTTDDTSTLWIWLVVAIAAVVIVGLVWYYGTQNNTTHHGE